MNGSMLIRTTIAYLLLLACALRPNVQAGQVDASSLRGKVVCGYQGWFRCPGDAAGLGWVHWSRSRKQIVPATLTFEMWPDLSDYTGPTYAAPGFTNPDGSPARLFW